MPANLRSVLVFSMAILTLAGFAFLSGFAIYQTAVMGQTPVFSEPYVYVANILAGLVGGVVAAGFGQALPPTTTLLSNALQRNLHGLGNFIVANKPKPSRATSTAAAQAQPPSSAKDKIAFIYVIVYLLCAVAAIVVWVVDSNVPDIVKNLATVSIGMIVAIVTAFFRP
jgi:hypothetical protein